MGASRGIREAQSSSNAPYDRYAVGLHHLAFEASSKEMVDERFRWAVAQGVAIEDQPQERSYVAGCYATFFHDPDGRKLEVVFGPSLERPPR